ncbi:MAG: ROK family protein [bacterium]|nr:ROK family protein [bacterium]
MSHKLSLGIDLGGTAIKAVVIDESGNILNSLQVDTPPGRAVNDVTQAIVDLINSLYRDRPGIVGVGLGSPGLVDEGRKIIRFSPNFPGWQNVPLWKLIKEQVSLPLALENDVNCFALAEHHWGAGRTFKHLLGLAVGTGVGGAVILNDQLYRGSSGAAGELGHVSVDLWGPKCPCGNFGCVERYLGVQWFIEAAREALDDDQISAPDQVSSLAAQGNQNAIAFLENRGEILGSACVSLIHAFDPEAIIIGGGIAQSGEPFFRGIKRAIQERAYPVLADHVQVRSAKLGTSAGAIGAAIIGFETGSLL